MKTKRIEVDYKNLVTVLRAVMGPPHHMAELRVMHSSAERGLNFGEHLDPLGDLIKEVNDTPDQELEVTKADLRATIALLEVESSPETPLRSALLELRAAKERVEALIKTQ